MTKQQRYGSYHGSNKHHDALQARLILLLAALALCELGMASTTPTTTADQFVGLPVCAQCHAEQVTQWSGSHHDQAMQPADQKTILGDFNNARLSHFGVTSSFYKRDNTYWVRAEGPDGKLQNYQIKYTFGVHPLQQYLVEFPGGRLQALSLAWDARQKEKGGQRWFHLYPHEKITHDDELHWTKLNYNWNTMCAECHSTHLQKNYDPVARTFSTTWSEINVSCEACHGPGSQHVDWAKREPGWEKLRISKGLVLTLDERKGVNWKINPQTGNAVRSEVRRSDKEIEMCARCHSRRSPISKNYVHGEPLLNHYLPRLLEEGMYEADGQIDDEVYVYGSFLQSKMYHAGVTCSDCHNPHSLALKGDGNGVCLQCHQAGKYDQASHHFHELGTQGASCAECHMPTKTYMVVDPRHDHSMRIPRPDLSVKLGTPNACNNCHKDKDAKWAAAQVRTWYGHIPTGFQTFAQALHAARQDEPRAGDGLAALIRNPDVPAIARATALAEMGPYLSPATADILQIGLSDESSLLRYASVSVLDYVPPQLQRQLALYMLDDEVRAVRMEAARLLAPIPADALSTEQQASLQRGLQAYIDAQQTNAERPAAQTNLGGLYADKREFAKAVSAYRTALELDPAYTPAYVNLANVYRRQGQEAQVEKVLREAVNANPDSADIHHALGLALVRQKREAEAIEELRLATTLNPDNARYLYVYGVALNSAGKPQQAIGILRKAHHQHPNNRDILSALVAFYRDMGNESAARIYFEKLRNVSP
jgi:predicted CXXCH cytochrome family protein